MELFLEKLSTYDSNNNDDDDDVSLFSTPLPTNVPEELNTDSNNG